MCIYVMQNMEIMICIFTANVLYMSASFQNDISEGHRHVSFCFDIRGNFINSKRIIRNIKRGF